MALLHRGVLAKDTHGSTVRLSPPLTITEEDLDVLFEAFEGALDDLARDNPTWRGTAAAGSERAEAASWTGGGIFHEGAHRGLHQILKRDTWSREGSALRLASECLADLLGGGHEIRQRSLPSRGRHGSSNHNPG